MNRKVAGIAFVLVVLFAFPAILFAEDVSLDTLTVWVQEVIQELEEQSIRLDAIEERLAIVENQFPTETATPVSSPMPTVTVTPSQNQESVSEIITDGGREENCQLALRNRVDFQSLETYVENWPDNILPTKFEIVSVSLLSEKEIGILIRIKSYMGDAIYRDESWYHGKDRFFLEVWNGCDLVTVHVAELNKNELPVVEGACRLAAKDRIQLSSVGSYMEQWPDSALSGNAAIVSVWYIPDEGTAIVFEPLWSRDGGNSSWGGRYLTERWNGCEFAGGVWGEDDVGWTRGGYSPTVGDE